MTAETIELVELEQPAEAAKANTALAVAENSPAAMLLALHDRGASLEQIEKMMELQAKWERGQAEKAFNAAFAAFRGEDLQVLTDKARTNGPLSGQRYATLHAYVKATKEALSKHGLTASWKVTRDEPEWIEVTCVLKHAQGHFETVSMGGPPDNGPARNVLQARHSTVSYLERYTLKAICGLAEQDDDDDGAGGARAGDDGHEDADLELRQAGRDASMEGMKSLTDWWGKLDAKQRGRLQKDFGGWRAAAAGADRAK